MIEISPEKLAQFEAERKAHIAEYQKVEEEIKRQNQETKAAYEAKRKPPHIVTTNKIHQCTQCLRQIAKGEQATIKSSPNGSSGGAVYTVHWRCDYFCTNCVCIGGT